MSPSALGAPPEQTPDDQPVIPASTSLPELTVKAIVLGVLLAVVLAGVIFTIPALVLMGWWETFNYWQVTAIAAVGGIVGVLFTIPLRRALVVEEKLLFPEGVATAEVLKTGGAFRDASGEMQEQHPELAGIGGSQETQRRSIRALAVAGLVGGGVIAWIASRRLGGREPAQTGLLFASGLITGEALVGILLALPIVLAQVQWLSGIFSAEMFEIFATPPMGGWPGLLVLAGVAYWLLRLASQEPTDP